MTNKTTSSDRDREMTNKTTSSDSDTIQAAIDHLFAEPLGEDWVYCAPETDAWYRVTRADLVALGKSLTGAWALEQAREALEGAGYEFVDCGDDTALYVAVSDSEDDDSDEELARIREIAACCDAEWTGDSAGFGDDVTSDIRITGKPRPDAYSLWCGEVGAERLSCCTYTIYDAHPATSGGTEWPSHTDVEVDWQPDRETVLSEVRDALEFEAAGLSRGDGYDAGQRIYASVNFPEGDSDVVSYELTEDDLD